MKPKVFQSPRLNWESDDQKELFIRRLKGELINFGYVEAKDQLAFFQFLTEMDFLEYKSQKEWQGLLGEFLVIEDLGFNIDRDMSSGQRWLSVNKGDTVLLTELIPCGKQRYYHSGDGELYTIFVDVSPEERAKIYEM